MKCAFWLALVYAALLYGFGPIKPVSPGSVSSKVAPRQEADDMVRAGETAARSALSEATGGVAVLCARHPAECVADAARLKALFDSSGAVDPVAFGPATSKAPRADRRSPTRGTADVGSVAADVPMPVADPRRQGRVSRLTSRL